ncbi:hypothetical protein BCR33DRAFT_780342 [Rhizoclosmatium globosum]|uniref:Aromatic amino acid beta-eliminating lyase/threonine aldolase domain-containing protein n=1 Tax=Rhizoclosmatium globosum TaxID=329046 RepID=A0A1Y2CWI4_9FUNG|nr:hypothetical protein BCR33DRAFT_780342 [Rhizoclosmatium globosum]|eukprot:ORY51347.1 hypothetical protein BCR33DRAFT_780342 [Rhizoclosmatium globosum]
MSASSNSAGVQSMYSAGSGSTVVPASALVADLRSDTVTTPTDEMRKVIASALVGDDVFEDDPTINALEDLLKETSGHPASLFCATGTMTNQLAIRSLLLAPPHSVLVDSRSHIYNYESSAVAHHTQALLIPIAPKEGKRHLTADVIERHLILDDDVHHAPTKLICLENTLGGEIFPYEDIVAIREMANKHGVKLHLDGARLWNASAETGISMEQYCSLFDTVSLCLSKGMGAPIGSVLVGSKEVIKKARHYRKLFGGGWRQGGLLAAAGIHAINHHFPNLKNDHETARYLAAQLTELGFPTTRKVETNMVWFDTTPLKLTGTELQVVLAANGVRILGGAMGEQRWVVHHQVTKQSVDHIINVLREFLSSRQ